jgi:hypothetical protein
LPASAAAWPEPDETAETFQHIAEEKAAYYSRCAGGLAIASDAGAVFPGLTGWDPLKTKRFAEGDDETRALALLELMAGATDRTVQWHEALAVADRGRVVFSTVARAMDGQVALALDPARLQPGLWLCAVTEFPQFDNRNFFDLTPAERAATEDSWSVLGERLCAFIATPAGQGLK